MKRFNPPEIVQPASNYSQGVSFSGTARRLVISGQIGAAPDGRIEQGFEAQSRRAWSNLLAVLAHEGMTAANLVKVTVFVTEPGRTAAYRTLRDSLQMQVRERLEPLVTGGSQTS